MTDIRIDAGEIVLVDADQRGLIFYHVTGLITIIPHAVLETLLKDCNQ